MEHSTPIGDGTPVSSLLRDAFDQQEACERLGRGDGLRALALRSAALAAAGSALFGAALGSYAQAPLQIVASALKLPLLVLGTAAICFPTFLVVQTLRGRRPLSPLRALAIQLNALAVTGIVWGSFSLPVLFLVGTTGHYELAHWLALSIGAAGGAAGFSRFRGAYCACSGADSPRSALRGLAPYFVLFAAVGGQLAWTLRPFIGSPSLGFQMFRPLEGNLFTHILGLLT